GQKCFKYPFPHDPCVGMSKCHKPLGVLPFGLYRSGYFTHHFFNTSKSLTSSTKKLYLSFFEKTSIYSNMLLIWPLCVQGTVLSFAQIITSCNFHPISLILVEKSNGRGTTSLFCRNASMITQRVPESFVHLKTFWNTNFRSFKYSSYFCPYP